MTTGETPPAPRGPLTGRRAGSRDAPPIAIVTGASSGIGAAIAARLARPGLTVGLVGRNEEGIDRAAYAVKQRGGKAVTSLIDVTTPAFATWVEDVAERHCLSALYANAGVSAGPRSPSEFETAEDTDRLIATNLAATIANVRAVVEAMRRQGTEPRPRRHVALVSSIAALMPIPDLAVYAATKSGLVAYAHALRPRLRKHGISVTVTCPGFVTTPMSARHQGAKPFEMPADQAARRIVTATERGVRTHVFPLPFWLLAHLHPIAPGFLVDAIVPAFDASVAPDPRHERPRRRPPPARNGRNDGTTNPATPAPGPETPA